MDNLLQTGGAGGIGAIAGSILTFFGFKKRIENLEANCVTKDTCSAVVKGTETSLHSMECMMKEMRTDIKAVLRNGNNK